MMKTYVILDLSIESYPLVQMIAAEHHSNDNGDEKISFLFLQNSVLLFLNRGFETTYDLLRENNIDLFVVENDVIARGIDLTGKEVNVISYDDVVDLLMDKSEKVFNL